MKTLNTLETQLVSAGTSTYEVMASTSVVGVFLGVIKADPKWWLISLFNGALVSAAILLDDYMGYETKSLHFGSSPIKLIPDQSE